MSILRQHYFSIFVSFALMADTAIAAPRLLVVTKGDSLAFFVPTAHYALDAEVDNYLDDVIEPAFQHSTELVVERASIGVPGGQWADNCPNERQSKRDSRLQPIVDRLLPHSPLRLTLAARKDDLSIFESAMVIMTSTDMIDASTEHPPVEGALLARASKPIASIETADNWHSAYCLMSSADRDALDGFLITSYRSESLPGAAVPSAAVAFDQAIEALQRDVLGESFTKKALPDRNPLSRWIVAARTETWMKNIDDRSKVAGVPIYMLGALHFPDTDAGPGLISRLRQRGYTVRLIADRKELDPYLEPYLGTTGTTAPAAAQRLSQMIRAGTAPNIVRMGPIQTDERAGTAHEMVGKCQDVGNLPASICSYESTDGSEIVEVRERTGTRVLTVCMPATATTPTACEVFRIADDKTAR